MRIAKVGVVGAGAMGAGIAALAASAGFPVVLLDVPDVADRNARARAGVDRAAALSLLAVAVVDLVVPDGMAAGVVAELAAVLVALRLSR